MSANTRIDKLFSVLGIMSRSECKKAVKQGKIAVNGVPCRSSDDKCDPDSDEISLDGVKVDTRLTVYYMMNKPAGVITAADDPRCRTVMDFVEDGRADLAPVGRLDKDTTGFLLITNDGQLNHRLLSPRYHVPKTYLVLIDGVLTEQDIKRLENGLDIGDDKPTLPAVVEIPGEDGLSGRAGENRLPKALANGLGASVPVNCQLVKLTITEGRFHQVKRMFEAVGKPVILLHRQSFGPIDLDPALEEGHLRELKEDELKKLMNCTNS